MMLKRLEQIHEYNYVHRDVKPGNTMIDRSANGDLNYLYLIDFSLAKKWTPGYNATELRKWRISQNLSEEAPPGESVVGTVIYAPIQAHLPGFYYDKRDDLEGLCYVIKHMRTNDLPWKNLNTTTDDGLREILKLK
jgi:tau tubulin kinase